MVLKRLDRNVTRDMMQAYMNTASEVGLPVPRWSDAPWDVGFEAWEGAHSGIGGGASAVLK